MARRRRQSSTQYVRDNASDGPCVVEGSLDVRVAALERVCGEMHQTLDVQFKRIAAIQAQLDHLAAKVTGR